MKTFYPACIGLLLAIIAFTSVYARTRTIIPPSFSVADASVTEGTASVTITITKSGSATRQQSTIQLYTQDGTATAGSDYTAVNTTVTFGPRDYTKTVSIPIINDNVVESQVEGFTVKIVALTNARLLDGTAAVNIFDNDVPPPVDTLPPPGSQFDSIASNFTTSGYLATATIPGPEIGTGAFRFICNASHLGYDDPIVHPGQQGASHLHQFFGNTLTDYNSTYSSLRTTGKSSCNNKLNRSAYWHPAMLDGHGNVVIPDWISVYYKRLPLSDPKCTLGNPQAIGNCVRLPRGLRYVFDRVAPSGQVTGWFNCTGPTAIPGTYPDIVEAAKNCPLGNQFGSVIFAPQCWDGVHLDSADHRSHMAYADYSNGLGYLQCPATHPYVIPQLQIGLWYAVDANLDHSGTWNGENTSWHLSSDEMAGMPMMRPGTSQHADWFGAWDDTILGRWEDACIDMELNCDSGNLGDGQMLKIMDINENPLTGYNYIASPHSVPVPVHP